MTAFAAWLGTVQLLQFEQHKRDLLRAAVLLQKAAKDKIGNPDSTGLGGQPWAELAEATQADRVEKGYSADETLLRDGKLGASIGVRTADLEAAIGSDLDIAVWQELGTAGSGWGGPIPPRSFLGSAGAENAEKVRDIVGEGAMLALRGR